MNKVIFLIFGYLTSLLFPPYFFFPFGFIIFPFLCHYTDYKQNNLKKNITFTNIFLFSIGFFTNFLFWIQNPFYVFEDTKKLFFLSFILIILLGLIFTCIFLIIIKFNKYLPTIFKIPIIFVLSEYIIANIFYGFPWVSFSLIVSSNEYCSFILKNFGTLITSYIVIQLFCLPYLFIKIDLYKFFLKTFSLFCLIPLILIILYHNFKHRDLALFEEKLNFQIIQLNHQNQALDNNSIVKMDTIISYIYKSNAELIIFAENNYPYLIDDLKIDKIQSVLKRNQTVIIGGTRIEDSKYFNTFLNITHDKVKYFDKKILVPFGEFLPFRDFINFFEPISGLIDYQTGQTQRIIKLNSKINYIPIICYEIIFYWKIVNNFNRNSNFIINITNDSWFGNLLGPYQHFYFSKIRAAEFNKPIIRVSNNGISGIVDNNGKIIMTTNLNTQHSSNHSIYLNNNINYFKTHNVIKIYFFILVFLSFLFNQKKNEHR